jgi:hypothetical protein
VAELEAELDRLYGLPLDEFVRERDALARQLRRGGRRDAAEQVKALRKPTAGAWALNQALRRRRRERDALLAAGERLRAAHAALLSGDGPDELRAAMVEERALVGALAECAETIASETGKSGAALEERVRATLHAAAVDDEARAELESGRFVREREAVGLGPLAAPAPAGGKRGGRDQRLAAAQLRLDEARGALDEARAVLARMEAAHGAAEIELESARERLRDAQAGRREARRALTEHERELAKRDRELERLRNG